MKRHLIAAFLMLLLAACSQSSSPEATPETANPKQSPAQLAQTVREAMDKRDYAQAGRLMETEADEYRMFPQYYTVFGRDKAEFSGGATRHRGACSPEVKAELKSSIRNDIAELVSDHRLVIINEAHDSAQHRFIIRDLLASLRESGFTHYAAETFWRDRGTSHDDWKKDLIDRGHITPEDGFYTNAPIFAELVEHSLSLGFIPVAYEAEIYAEDGATSAERITLRESEQAKNLWERVLNDPEAKVVVHVGYSHARETPDNRGNVWMAQRIKETYGIDPLTLSQTVCIDDEYEGEGWRYRLADNDEAFDVFIHSRPETLIQLRPDWLSQTNRIRVSAQQFIPEVHKDNDVIVLAEKAGFDGRLHERVFVRAGEQIDLALAPGDYQISILGPGPTRLHQVNYTAEKDR